MKLRPADSAAVSRGTDHLTLSDFFAACNRNVFGVSIGGDIAARVRDQDKIAVAAQGACVTHRAIRGGAERRTQFGSNVDALVARSVFARTEGRNHSAGNRPGEPQGILLLRMPCLTLVQKMWRRRAHLHGSLKWRERMSDHQ